MDNPQKNSEELRRLAQEVSEFYTMMLANLYKKVVERFGKEEGEKAIRAGLREFGLERGRIVRAKVDAHGLPPTMENFIKFKTVPTSASQKSKQTFSEIGRIKEIEYCASASCWLKRKEEEIGILYCDEVDSGIIEGYNPDIKHENPKNPLRGDDLCVQHDFYINK